MKIILSLLLICPCLSFGQRVKYDSIPQEEIKLNLKKAKNRMGIGAAFIVWAGATAAIDKYVWSKERKPDGTKYKSIGMPLALSSIAVGTAFNLSALKLLKTKRKVKSRKR